MSLILKQETANSVPTPSAGKGTIFINDSNVLSVKISSGTTSTFPTVVSTNTQVIFNNADSLEGNANFTWNRATSTLSATNVSASGNVTGNYILGNGALLTGVITSVANINSGTSNVTVVSSGGNVTVGVGGTSNVAVFATTGTYVTGIVSASGNVIGSNITTAGLISATANITGGNVLTGGLVSATGTVTGSSLLGSVVSASANVTGGNILTAGVVSAAGAGIFGAGLSVTGNITATGNINYQNVTDLVVGDPLIYIGANNTADLVDLGIVASANVAGTYQHLGIVRDHATGIWRVFSNVVAEPTTVVDWANSVYAPLAAGAITSNSTISASGNITGGNLIVSGGSGGNLTGGNVISANTFTATANITGGNILTGGLISATGNITGGNVLGGANVNATTHTGTTVSVSANITGGNVLTGGLISATGNITGSYLFGNGSQLTGIAASANAAGSNTYVQFNDGGVFGASANLTFDKATNTLNATTVTANGVQLATTGKAIAMAIVFGF